MLIEFIFYILLGYFSGGLMFGYVIPKVIKGIDVRSMSSDGNPGTANAFFYGGAVCGIAVLLCDVLKGLLPVHWALKCLGPEKLGMGVALVMAAPVAGHAFPLLGDGRKAGRALQCLSAYF